MPEPEEAGGAGGVSDDAESGGNGYPVRCVGCDHGGLELRRVGGEAIGDGYDLCPHAVGHIADLIRHLDAGLGICAATAKVHLCPLHEVGKRRRSLLDDGWKYRPLMKISLLGLGD